MGNECRTSKGELVRQKIIDAADRLFYLQGYEKTSFTDISDDVDISRGNFYYHFKSKNEILAAVIQKRLEAAREMLTCWDKQFPDAATRLVNFVDILTHNTDNIVEHGCPFGSLCAEMAKLKHALQPDAQQQLELFRDWLAQQFTSLGFAGEATELAMHLLARSQGIALLSNTFADSQFLTSEAGKLKRWVTDLVVAKNSH